MARDHATYDGRNVRTGEEMTEEGWDALQASHGKGLPTWNPRRANDMVTVDLTSDATIEIVDVTPPAEVIDLRGRERSSTTEDDVFEMPPWARGEQVFRGERE